MIQETLTKHRQSLDEALTKHRHLMKPSWLLTLVLVAASSRGAGADTVTFHFAPLGSSYSAALFDDDPLVGEEITAARVYLEIESFEGSDAAAFATDLLLPIEPLPGGEGVIALSGEELGWSGAGQFSYFDETTQFNGTFVARRYGAETFGEGFAGRLVDGRIEFDVPGYRRGDFDDDGDLDSTDIDWLADAIIVGQYSRAFDLNGDGGVDLSDHQSWVKELKQAWYGDADLDGVFNSGDLVRVLQAGEYEDSLELNSTWATGDWNADGEFTTSDLIVALQDGGYTASAVPVPEPSSLWVWTLAMLAGLWRKRFSG
jgi:hypothetical protein